MMMRKGILLERQGNPHGGRVLVAESAIPLRPVVIGEVDSDTIYRVLTCDSRGAGFGPSTPFPQSL